MTEDVERLREGSDFYAGRYAERCGDVLKLREENAQLREALIKIEDMAKWHSSTVALEAVLIARQALGATNER